MCTLKQLEPSLSHNERLNGGKKYPVKDTTVLAWGICYFFSKHNLIPKQTKIIDIAEGDSSPLFKDIMTSISEKKHMVFLRHR